MPDDLNIDELEKLLEAIERDLAELRGADPEKYRTLQAEVETLRNVLNSPRRRHHWLREALHDLRQAIEDGGQEAIVDAALVNRYVVAIGRILGL